MAGDWIKMRVGLVNHPKVIQLSEILSYDDDYQEWSGLHGFVPSIGGDRKSFDEGIYQALRVTRYVTVTALLKFWGYANEHIREEFISSLRIQDIDEIAQVPGFGNALSEVGWVVFDEESRGVFLPNFSEHNVSSGDRTNADRQKRHREKKKLENENSNVTRNENSNAREEKRREENISTSLRSVDIKPDFVDPEIWDSFIEVRKGLKARNTDRAIKALITQLTSLKEQGFDPNEVVQQSVRSSWKDLYPIKAQAHKQGIQLKPQYQTSADKQREQAQRMFGDLTNGRGREIDVSQDGAEWDRPVIPLLGDDLR
jgi:hypothetical protein